VGGDVSIDSEALLVTDFVNLKIKPAQSFRGTHRDRVCVCVHRNECSYVYKYLHLYCVSKKIKDIVLQMIQRVGAHPDQAEACKATIQSCRAKPGQGFVLCDYSVLKSTKLSEII
jgi:hypothetical protein